MPIVPDTQEAEIGGSRSEANPSKISWRPYPQNQAKIAKRLGECLK
jgi:hypothetical protein